MVVEPSGVILALFALASEGVVYSLFEVAAVAVGVELSKEPKEPMGSIWGIP
jgi:hypothetical protein